MTPIKLLWATLLVAVWQCNNWAMAQNYPSRPITMIVPNPAGGPMDTVARILTVRMRSTLGKPIIIENVPGASGSMGTGRLARAAADGHTLGIGGWSQYVANGAIYALNYDVAKDFAPVTLIATQPLLLV